jgi:hypothetical protein
MTFHEEIAQRCVVQYWHNDFVCAVLETTFAADLCSSSSRFLPIAFDRDGLSV